MRPAIVTLPTIPSSAAWVLPKRTKLRHARLVHIAHRAAQVTLCSRVRPGAEAGLLPEDFHLCRRCVYRASLLWGRI